MELQTDISPWSISASVEQKMRSDLKGGDDSPSPLSQTLEHDSKPASCLELLVYIPMI